MYENFITLNLYPKLYNNNQYTTFVLLLDYLFIITS